MISMIATATLLFVSTQAQTAKAPQPDLHPVIQQMANFVGGTWRGEVAGSDGKPMVVEFTYQWTADKKGIKGAGVIGKGNPSALEVWNQFGVDPLTKKVYYLDSHNSETVYFGYADYVGGEFEFVFGPIGGQKDAFRSRGKFLDKDSYAFKIGTKEKDGDLVGGTVLKRVR